MGLTEQLLAFPPTDEGHAHAVKFLYGDAIRYSNKSGWSHWDGTEWVTDRYAVRQLVVATLRRRKYHAHAANMSLLEQSCNCDLAPINKVMNLLAGLQLVVG